jgi:hypothetical protein
MKSQAIQKKKKDFKIREDIVSEFESLAPSGKQTAIVETLISNWISEQKKKQIAVEIKLGYQNALNIQKERKQKRTNTKQ